jgi:hypothetical protein
MDNLTFVQLGGEYRPVTYNFNVQSNLEDYRSRYDEEQEKVERLVEERRREKGEELTAEEIEEISQRVSTQKAAQNTRLMVFLMLKEGHRKANQDFTTTAYRITPDEEGNPVREEIGEREVTEEDVGEWIDDADEEATDRILEVFENYQATQQQKEQLEKHEARDEGGGEAKK